VITATGLLDAGMTISLEKSDKKKERKEASGT